MDGLVSIVKASSILPPWWRTTYSMVPIEGRHTPAVVTEALRRRRRSSTSAMREVSFPSALLTCEGSTSPGTSSWSIHPRSSSERLPLPS